MTTTATPPTALQNHVSIDTPDLARSRAFYSALFGKEPVLVRADYVRFWPAELGLVLAQYARRSMDMAARLGGDEFALLLYDCDLNDGRERLAELLDTIRNLGIEHRANHAAVVTVSAGGVAVGPNVPLSDAYHAADHCLYKAKHAGRDNLYVEDLAEKAARRSR